MGIISGFLGGAGEAAAFVGKTYLIDQLQREKDEVNALRESNLRLAERKEAQEFTSAERVAGEKSSAAESKLDRQSDKDIAAMKETADKDEDKYAFVLAGKPMKYSDVVNAYKADTGEDADTEEDGFHKWAARRGYQINTKDGATDIPGTAAKTSDKPPSTSDVMNARTDYNNTSTYMDSDEDQFGMTEAEYMKLRSEEYRDGIAKPLPGKKGKGIIGKQANAAGADAPSEAPGIDKNFGVDPGHLKVLKQFSSNEKVLADFKSFYAGKGINLTDEMIKQLIAR